MRTITVAFVSFVLGATLTSLYGNQTSNSQPSQQPSPPSGGAIARMVGMVPEVPALRSKGTLVMEGDKFHGGIHAVDGTECVDCSFTDVVFEYGGGAYRLENSHFSGKIGINLKGAAANTVVFLNSFGIGLCKLPPATEHVNPNTPIMKTASFESVRTISLLSPYGQP